MKVKNLFPGMIQILLAVGIFAGAGMMYHLNQEANAQKASRLAEQQKKEAIRLAAQLEQAHALKAICVNLQATLPLHEKSLSHLHSALEPLQLSVDAIVSLRDYTVMQKKPFYAVGNAFAGLQESIQSVRDSLLGAQINFHRIAALQQDNLIPATEKCIVSYTADLAKLQASDTIEAEAAEVPAEPAPEAAAKVDAAPAVEIQPAPAQTEIAPLPQQLPADMDPELCMMYVLLAMCVMGGLGFLFNGISICLCRK